MLGILSGSMKDIYPSRFDMFRYFDGQPERLRRMVDLGLLPWWADGGVRVAWWRPVAALTHWVDYTLWHAWPLPMRLHSLCWLAALIIAVYATYRQFMGLPAAGLAALLYALDRPHGFNTIEVSSRNTLLAALFGVLAVLFHDRWRRGGWRLGAIVAPGCFALALLSAENAVASGAYVVAHAVFLEKRGSWSRRLRPLLPYGLVVVVWHLLYSGLGYGIAGTPDYTNPVREPVRFAYVVVERGPVLLSAEWFGPHAESVIPLPQTALVKWGTAVVFLAIMFVLLASLLSQNPVARFWGLGQILAVVPLCAGSDPHDRYLLIIGLGAMGLLGQFLMGVASETSWRTRGRVAKRVALAVACGLLVIHLIKAPWQVVGDAIARASIGPAPDTLPTDPAIRRQVLVLVNAPSGGAGLIYWFFERAVKNLPIPGQTRALTFGLTPLRIERIDADAVRVRWEGPHEVLRPPARPLVAGQRTRLAGADVEVTAMSLESWPVEAIFRFDDSLDGPKFRWVAWDKSGSRFAPFQPPAIGESVIVR